MYIVKWCDCEGNLHVICSALAALGGLAITKVTGFSLRPIPYAPSTGPVNLSAEMARYGVSNMDIQSLLGCSSKTVTNKLSDNTAFSVTWILF